MNIKRALFLQHTTTAKKTKNISPMVSLTHVEGGPPLIVPLYYFVSNRFWKKYKAKSAKAKMTSDNSGTSSGSQKRNNKTTKL